MAAKMPFKGSKLECDTSGGTTYTSVADLAGLQPPQKKRGTGETTIAEATNDYREFIPCFKEGGEIKARLRFHKTQYATLDAAFESDTIPAWRISFPTLSGESTPSRWTASAIIAELGKPEKSVDGDDVWEVEITLKITGKPTFASGS